MTFALSQRAAKLIGRKIAFIGMYMSGFSGQGADKLTKLIHIALISVDMTGNAVKTVI